MTGPTPRRELMELMELPAVRALLEEAAGRPVHLVGGVLRDRLLGRETHDLDAVVAGGGRELAERLAERLPARLVLLGGERFAAYRLVTEEANLDLWDRSAASLEEDLARRDFTVNAIALDLASGELVDPFGGFGDLERRLLRATSVGSFGDDPLRVLRLARLAAELPGFTAGEDTVTLARAVAVVLPAMASERIREELLRLFAAAGALAGANLLAATHLYPGLWLGTAGEPAPAARFLALLQALDEELPRLLAILGPEAAGTREGPARAGSPEGPDEAPARLDATSARLASSFLGLPAAADPAASLARFEEVHYLSRNEAGAVRALLASVDPPAGEVGQRRFLNRVGDLWPTAVAVVSARCRAEGDPGWLGEPREQLLALAAREAPAILRPPRLLSGEDVQALLGLAPGPALGRALGALRQAQVDGLVTTRQQALRFVREAQAAAEA